MIVKEQQIRRKPMCNESKPHNNLLVVMIIILLLLESTQVLFSEYAKQSDKNGYNACRQFIIGGSR